jgi:hypothetical protein
MSTSLIFVTLMKEAPGSSEIQAFLRSVRRLLVAACVVPSSPIFVTLIKEAPGSSETSVLTRATRRNNPEDTIIHSHRREKPQILHTCINLHNFLCLMANSPPPLGQNGHHQTRCIAASATWCSSYCNLILILEECRLLEFDPARLL